jgi:hypothetical protein
MLTLQNNRLTALIVNDTSNASLSGTLLIENSGGEGGLLIALTSTVLVGEASTMTVSNSINGSGLRVFDNSTLRVNGTVVSANNAIDGLLILRGAVVRVEGANAQMQLLSNLGRGVRLGENAVGQFFNGTIISDNGGVGIESDGGSIVESSGATISGNGAGAGPDILASFGSRLTLNGNAIGILPITCDGTVLSRGDVLCP